MLDVKSRKLGIESRKLESRNLNVEARQSSNTIRQNGEEKYGGWRSGAGSYMLPLMLEVERMIFKTLTSRRVG